MNTTSLMTDERIAELKAREIDYSDIPKITDFSQCWLRRDRLSGKVKPHPVQDEDGTMHTVFE